MTDFDTDDSDAIDAACKHVDSKVAQADAHIGIAPMWYGWCVREAFLAGVEFEKDRARLQKDKKK